MPLAAIAASLSGLAWSQAPAADPALTSLESLLQTRVVTASRFSEDLVDAPGVISVVSREDIQRFGGLTLREILNRVPGLSLATNTFTDASIISVRGEQVKDSSSHVLFLINGRATREVLQSGVMTELLDSFPVGVIERIEVIEGPGSVLYGSNAYSGVINIITKRADRRGGAARGFGSANGSSGGAAEGSFQRGAVRVIAGAQFRQDSRWNTLIAPDLGPGASLPFQPFPLYSRNRGAFAEVGYKGFSAMVATMDALGPYETYGFFGQRQWRRTFADVGYDTKLAPHWDSGLHATYSAAGLQSNNSFGTWRKGGELELNWSNSIAVHERLRVTFGALYNFQYGTEKDTVLAAAITATDASRSSVGLYGELQFRLLDNLQWIGGVQTNKVGGTAVRSVPRTGVLWTPLAHWHFKALYAQAFRAPSLNEAETHLSFLNGTANLRPELASTFDMGVVYRSRSLQSSINYFRSKQSNTIIPVQVGALASGLGIFAYQNADGLLFDGIQGEAKWYLTRRLLGEASALYQTNEDIYHKRVTLPTAAFGAKAGLSFADSQGWTVGLFDVYTGAIPGFAASNNPKPSPRHLASANLRLNLEKYFGARAKDVTLFAHGDNLGNRTVWAPAWGFTSAGTLPVQRGRTIYYGIEFSFRRE